MPLTLLGMIAFYMPIFTINNPDGQLALITSYIPFFTPFRLVVRAQTSGLQIYEVNIICFNLNCNGSCLDMDCN